MEKLPRYKERHKVGKCVHLWCNSKIVLCSNLWYLCFSDIFPPRVESSTLPPLAPVVSDCILNFMASSRYQMWLFVFFFFLFLKFFNYHLHLILFSISFKCTKQLLDNRVLYFTTCSSQYLLGTMHSYHNIIDCMPYAVLYVPMTAL